MTLGNVTETGYGGGPAINEKIKVELTQVLDKNGNSTGGHAFLILNRKQGSSLQRPETWGDAVICDPWSEETYSVKEALANPKKFAMWDYIKSHLNTTKEPYFTSFIGPTYNHGAHSAYWQERAKPEKTKKIWKSPVLLEIDGMPKNEENINLSFKKSRIQQ